MTDIRTTYAERHPYEPCDHPGRHGYTLPGEPEYAFCERCRRGPEAHAPERGVLVTVRQDIDPLHEGSCWVSHPGLSHVEWHVRSRDEQPPDEQPSVEATIASDPTDRYGYGQLADEQAAEGLVLTNGEDRYGDTVLFPQLVEVAGADGPAKVMLVPAGRSARRKHGGPQVPGPWADFILMATVISDPPQPYQQPIRLQPGDHITADGTTFVVSVSDGIGGKGERGWVRRGYPLLDPVEAQS